jgi:hypothetical protein
MTQAPGLATISDPNNLDPFVMLDPRILSLVTMPKLLDLTLILLFLNSKAAMEQCLIKFDKQIIWLLNLRYLSLV